MANTAEIAAAILHAVQIENIFVLIPFDAVCVELLIGISLDIGSRDLFGFVCLAVAVIVEIAVNDIVERYAPVIRAFHYIDLGAVLTGAVDIDHILVHHPKCAPDVRALGKNAANLKIAEFLPKTRLARGCVEPRRVPPGARSAHALIEIFQGDNKIAVFCVGHVIVPVRAAADG